jgi:hypothetical protein
MKKLASIKKYADGVTVPVNVLNKPNEPNNSSDIKPLPGHWLPDFFRNVGAAVAPPAILGLGRELKEDFYGNTALPISANNFFVHYKDPNKAVARHSLQVRNVKDMVQHHVPRNVTIHPNVPGPGNAGGGVGNSTPLTEKNKTSLGWSTRKTPLIPDYNIRLDASGRETAYHEGGHIVSHADGALANHQAFSGMKNLYNRTADWVNGLFGKKILPNSNLDTRSLAANLNNQQYYERNFQRQTPFTPVDTTGLKSKPSLVGGLITATTAPKDSFAARNAWMQPWFAKAPRLFEEAKASLLSIMEMRRKGVLTKDAIKNLAILGTTYAAEPAIQSAAIEAGYLTAPRNTNYKEDAGGRFLGNIANPVVQADMAASLGELGLSGSSFAARRLVPRYVAGQLARMGVTQALTTGAAGTGLAASYTGPAALVAGSAYGGYTAGNAYDQAINPVYRNADGTLAGKMLPQEYNYGQWLTRPDDYYDAVRKQTGKEMNSERPWEDLSLPARLMYNVDNWVNGTGANVPKERPLPEKPLPQFNGKLKAL